MPTYLLATGETIEYAKPAPDVAAFIERVRAAANNPGTTPAELLVLVNGVENPLLDTTSYPGYAIARKAALENPVYHMLADMAFRKQLAVSGKTIDDVLDTFTMSVRDAAKQLGLTETAVRSAIAARKLAAVKRNSEWYIHPNSVAAYKVSNRGRKKAADKEEHQKEEHQVTVFCGSKPGGSLAVRIANGELEVDGKEGGIVRAHFPPGWTRAVVKTTTQDGVRVFELEPTTAVDAELKHEVEHLGFMVAGEFKIVKKHNNTKAANEVWKKYASEKAAS